MASKKTKPADPAAHIPGEFAYKGLDRVLHEKARLGILTSLVTWPKGLVFGELKSLCALTDGNLNRHLKTLQEAGMIEIKKGYQDNHPQTLVRMTAQGRSKFSEYLEELERVIERAAAAQAAIEATAAARGTLRPRPA